MICVSSVMTFANGNKWFGEFGWTISEMIDWEYNSFDAGGGVHYDGESTDDMLYVELGYMFGFDGSDTLLALSGGTTFAILDSSDHTNVLFAKGALLFPFKIDTSKIYTGPTIKFLVPYNSYYYDDEDEEYAKKVKYDVDNAYSIGWDMIFDQGDFAYTLGVEYIDDLYYSGEVKDDTGYANSFKDASGWYFHIGIQYRF